MSRLTRDGTAEPVSRDQILRHARGQGNIHFPCSADHEQDWQPYPVDPYSAICDDHTYIHTYIHNRRKATQYFSSTFLLRCMPYFFSRQVFSRSFPSSSTVKSIFCTNELIVLRLLGILFFIFIFLVRKNPSSYGCTEIRTHDPTSEGFE